MLVLNLISLKDYGSPWNVGDLHVIIKENLLAIELLTELSNIL
jgi:hypothetical protein